MTDWPAKKINEHSFKQNKNNTNNNNNNNRKKECLSVVQKRQSLLKIIFFYFCSNFTKKIIIETWSLCIDLYSAKKKKFFSFLDINLKIKNKKKANNFINSKKCFHLRFFFFFVCYLFCFLLILSFIIILMHSFWSVLLKFFFQNSIFNPKK